ncbi:MAG: methyltransferase domain-containing protein [Blastocatellia bacterium]|nr:methyltransferase domain-containing protein [Blastocatellia bacterium]
MAGFSTSSEYLLKVDKEEFAPFAGSQDPLASWKLRLLRRGDLTREYLTRRVVCSPRLDEFSFLSRPLQIAPSIFQDEIRETAVWTYHVEAKGATTRSHGSYNDRTIEFHRYRKHLIADSVAKMLGADISRKTVLDIGCNCGFFTLEMAHLNANYALGVDFRKENISQANLLKHAFGVVNAEFEIANIKDYVSDGRQFDVVLNLGLMYHLSTPYEVMKLCFELARDFCVVDTITHTEPFSGFHVLSKDPSISIEGDLSFELQPTYRGILDTIMAAGFKEVVEIVAPVKGIELYEDGSRRCLVAFKSDPEVYIKRLLGEEAR